MRQTLFTIPIEIAGWPLFGPSGILAILWGIVIAVVTWRVLRKRTLAEYLTGEFVMLAVIGLLMVWLLPWIAGTDGIPVRGFGVMVLLGIVSGNALASWMAKRMGLDPEVIFSLALWVLFGGFLGARVFYVIQYWDQFASESVMGTVGRVANFTQGGIVVYGGILAGLASLIAFCRLNKLPVLAIADLVAPSIMLGLAFGRIGCLMNGCCYGGLCELPWSVTFPAGSPPFMRQFDEGRLPAPLLGMEFAPDSRLAPVIQKIEPGSYAEGLGLRIGMRITSMAGSPIGTIREVERLLSSLRPGERTSLETDDAQLGTLIWQVPGTAPRSLSVHPAQVYASINALLICLLLFAWYPYRKRDGEVAALLFTVYPVVRFLEERIRTDESAVGVTQLTISQLVGVGLLVVVGLFWAYLLRQPRQTALPPKTAAAS